MATDLERLVVQLSADIKGYENALKRAQGVTSTQTRRIQSQFDRMNRSVGAGLARLGAVLASGVALRGAKELLDATTRMENALKVAGLAGDELNRVWDRLTQSAQRNAAPLESLVTLYGRAALVQAELGVSTEELLGFTNNVALALRVAGADAQSASGALLQLSQALSGVVRAEEFNSILEGAPTIAQAAAAGLKEAGGSVAALRTLVIDGKVSSEAFFRAFEAGAPILEEKVAGATLTLDQRLTNLQTALLNAAREFNESTRAGETFGAEIDRVAAFVNAIDFDGLIGAIQGVIAQFAAGIEAARGFAATLGRITGAEEIGSLITGGAARREFFGGALTVTSQAGIQDRIDAAAGAVVEQRIEGLTEELLRARFAGGGPAAPKAGRLGGAATVAPVSLRDFAAPAGKGRGGGGGSRSRENDLAREIRQIQERTAAIQAETAAQAGLNPLIDDYGYAVEKASATQELLNAAKKAGLAVTPELAAQIDALAQGYANASAQAAQLAESQDRVRQAADEMRDLGRDVLGGFIRDLREGKSGAEALANALNKVADKLLDVALNSLFSGGGGLFGGGLGRRGGLLGGFLIPGILHGGGVAGTDGYGHGRAVSPSVFAGARRYHSGGVAGLKPGEVPAILQRGEIVLPRGAGRGGGRSETVRVVLQDDSGRMADIADQRIQTAAGPIVEVSVQRSLKATQQRMPGLLANAQTRNG